MKHLFGGLAAALIISILLGFSAITGAEEEHSHALHGRDHGNSTVDATVRLHPDPATPVAGESATLVFEIFDKEGWPVSGLSISHDRILHVVIIGSDLTSFGHIHPEDFSVITEEMRENARFPVKFTFPKAGKYLIAVDFAVNDTHMSQQFPLSVEGIPSMNEMQTDFTREKTFGEYRVLLSTDPGEIRAGQEVTLRYEIRQGDAPVNDLESYLSAPMHLAILRTDLGNFLHAHGDVPSPHGGHEPMGHIHGHVPDSFGPIIEAVVSFPAAGAYKVFGEVKHHGKVIVTGFMIRVE